MTRMHISTKTSRISLLRQIHEETNNTFCGTWYLPHSQVHTPQWPNCSYNYDRMHCACAKRPYFYFRSKIWRHHSVPRPRFIKDAKISAICVHLKQIYFYLIFAWLFRTSWPKMGVLGGKIGEGVMRYWPPTNSFLLFGVLTSVPILVKIDQEMRPWECSQTDRHTHTQTYRCKPIL